MVEWSYIHRLKTLIKSLFAHDMLSFIDTAPACHCSQFCLHLMSSIVATHSTYRQ